MIESVVIATRNRGKIREWGLLLGNRGIRAISLDDAGIEPSPDEDAIEVFETFEENAVAKARYFAARIPGVMVIADDSGLEVDALGGAPGVRSRRWCGRTDLEGQALYDENNRLLISELERVGALDDAARTAHFVCIAASARCERGAQRAPGGGSTGKLFVDERLARGTCDGRILHEPEGGAGFGYDPLFWSNDLGKSFGVSDETEKGAVSHRARAMALLTAML